MTITLGQLRRYARETAGTDASSVQSDREIMHWINEALEEIWIAHDWHWSLSSTRLTMLPQESGSHLSLTQGSRRVMLDPAEAEVFAQKLVDDRWYLLVDSEGRMAFELVEIEDAKTAWLKEGQVWEGATASGLSYTFVRSVYPIPGGATKILRVEDLGAYGDVAFRHPARFDYLVSVSPTHRGNRPEFYTLRKDKIELWPGPGAEYVGLGVTYKRPVQFLEDSAPDETEIDWPDDKKGLLYKAILVQGSLTQSKSAPVKYETALLHFDRALKRHKSEDSDKAGLGGPMRLEGLSTGGVDFSRLGGITDDFA